MSEETTVEQQESLASQVSRAKAEGKPYLEFQYKLTKSDDLISAIERLDQEADTLGYSVSVWTTDKTSGWAGNTIAAAVTWDDNGREVAANSGYNFPELPGHPSEEEQADVVRVLGGE